MSLIKVMAVTVATEPTLILGSPRVLCEKEDLSTEIPDAPGYGLAPDGRFLLRHDRPEGHAKIHVVLNFTEELKRRVPTH